MKQYVICQMINGEKYLAAYAETKQEAIEKAELLGLRTGNRYIVITCRGNRRVNVSLNNVRDYIIINKSSNIRNY